MDRENTFKRKILQKKNLAKKAEVMLISMPFGAVTIPSLGLSLLKAALAPLKLSSKLLYFNLRFAKMMGVNLYFPITRDRNCFSMGDWIFAGSLFNRSDCDEENYFKDFRNRIRVLPESHIGADPETLIKIALKMLTKVDEFLDESLHEVLRHQPRIVGFTCVARQRVASLALAKLIKEHSPEIFIVLGGPSCEGVMGREMVRQFSFIDAVVSGEGDIIFPRLVQRILKGEPLSKLQGVHSQSVLLSVDTDGCYPNAPCVSNMDDLPFVDYDDYFAQIETNRIKLSGDPHLLMETSRGCWWGGRKQCLFCGLRDANIPYRHKSDTRALDELMYLSRKYAGNTIQMVDNILCMDYFRNFIPELALRDLDVEIFYETRSNLKKEHVRALSNAGIRWVQPGIESLSTPILKLMRKGVSALQNIQFLKWCKEFGIWPFWNMLYGFPFEPPEEYAHMTSLIPQLVHLKPLSGCGRMSVVRFSPYFEHAKKFGLTKVQPRQAYNHIYPFKSKVVANLAEYFDYSYQRPQKVEQYTQPDFEDAIDSWKQTHETSDLFSIDKKTYLLICDCRPVAAEPLTNLSGLQRILYIACDGARSLSQLQRIVKEHADGKCAQEKIEEILQPLLDRDLMIRDGNAYLSLAIPVGTYYPKREILEQLQRSLNSLVERRRLEMLMEKIKLHGLPKDLKISKEELQKVIEKK